jgi:hypothetical protein
MPPAVCKLYRSRAGVVQAKLTPATATFAKTKVGAPSAPKTFTLANDLTVTLNRHLHHDDGAILYLGHRLRLHSGQESNVHDQRGLQADWDWRRNGFIVSKRQCQQ